MSFKRPEVAVPTTVISMKHFIKGGDTEFYMYMFPHEPECQQW